MRLNKKSKSVTFFLKSILIATILTSTIIPIFLLLNTQNIQWTLMAIFIWSLGSLLIFHPFVLFVYPHLMSRVGFYLLTSILIIISAWFNITMITLLLPNDYIYYGLFNATLNQISLVGSLYIIITNSIITNFVFSSPIEFYMEERLF